MKHRATLKKVFARIRNYRVYLFLSILSAAVSVASTLYFPILTGDAIDRIIAAGRVDFPGVFSILKVMAATVAATAAAQWIMNLCNNRLTFSVVRDIRNEAIERIQILPLSYLDGRSDGEIVSNVVADVDQFADGLLMGFTQFFTGVVTIVGTLGFMLSVNVWITLVVVLITPLSFFVAGFIAKHTYVMFRRQSEVRGRQTAFIDEMIGHQKIVQAYGRRTEAMAEFDAINEELGECSLKATFYSSITNPSTRFVNNIVYAGVGIVGAIFAVMGRLSVGQLSCFLTYANQYTKPFNEISGVVTELQNALACADRVFALIEEEPQIPDPKPAKEADIDGTVALSDVSFSYRPKQSLIRNFALDVKPGQRIAIVGPTGCGKTTLINLLMRFYDVQGGDIRIGGTSIYEMERRDVRGAYGMVLQDTWLKAGTVRENICMAKPDATEEEMVAAAKAAHSHNFIKRLPDGYDTWIGENGGGLSQGQKQLLCITRVMLCVPPMLILDEATSSIDTRTEIRIQEAFARLMKGRTSFIVAHRLSTIREADVILVMKDGNIIEQGSHRELMEKNGFYTELYNSQYR